MRIIKFAIVGAMLFASGCSVFQKKAACSDCESQLTTPTNQVMRIELNKKTYIWESLTPSTKKYDGGLK